MLSKKINKWRIATLAIFAALLIGGTATVAEASNLLQNGSFSGNLNGWVVNPALQTGTPPWTPLLADGSGVNLHPDSYGFNGTILYQNLNLTGIDGKTLSLSIKLTNAYAMSTGKTVALWLTYVDGSGNLQRVKVLNPSNSAITTGTVVTGSFDVPTGAQKIVKLEIVKEDYGEFHADDVVLWADGVTSGPLPSITDLSATSGAYGTPLTINGANFGTSQGVVKIGGITAAVASWEETAITVAVASPMWSGNVVVIAGGVESNLSQTFQVTSPYFTVDLLEANAKVIKGQAAEFLFKTAFYNGFTTTEGIALQLQGGDAATLSGKAAFTPVPIKGAGGVVLKINTADLAAESYTADIAAVNGSEIVTVGTLNLQVVTVSDIKFFEWDYTTTPYVKTYYTAMTVVKQGQLFVDTEVVGSDGQVFTGETGVVLSEVPASTPILGIFNSIWGYGLYAQLNGSTQLKATAPDGIFRTLDITVNFPTTSWISEIVLSAPDGAPPIYPLYNNRTAPITWFARGTTRLGWIGEQTSGMMNFEIDFLDKVNRSEDGLSATSTFTLQKPPTDIGTAILYAETNDGAAKAVIPLTTVNAAGTGLLSFGIRSLDPQAFAEMFKLSFYGTDNQLKFSRELFAMHIGAAPVLVGNIPPGTYKLLVAPGNTSVKPQWWPNAADISGAAPVTFTTDVTTGDIYFFAQSQPADATITLPTPPIRDFTSTLAGTGSVTFTASDPGFAWSAESSAAWITITSGVSGVGSGTVSYAVAANPYGATRTGTITIGGQVFTITQAGTGVIPSHVGIWGSQQLIHFDTGYDQVDSMTVPWYAEATRTTINEDGTGTMVMKKNDHNGELINQTKEFTYTMASNADGSLAMTITMDGETGTERLVISDGGRMGIVDGTGREGQQKLMVLYRIDPAKSYSVADMNGEYYNVGFERNATDVADPPLYGNGAFMAISGVHTFKGNGLYDYYGKANSVKIDGTNLIWDDSGQTDQAYSVGADGTITVGGGAFQGWLTGNGLAGGGGGAFVNSVNNQVGYFFLKKGDRAYTTANLAGKWALVSFGYDNRTEFQGFSSSFGTMICDVTGKCSVKLRDRWSGDNTTSIATDNLFLSVAADGSFGASLGGQSPAYAGAIGNNGNTIMLNAGFKYQTAEDPYHREIMIGVRASNIGDLAGGAAFLKGDVNGDGKVDLADAVLAIQVAAGMTPAGIRTDYTISGADVNGDGMVGPAEMLYILQYLAGLRP